MNPQQTSPASRQTPLTHRVVRTIGRTLATLVLLSGAARAQDDVIASARAASSEGRTAESIQMLERHLAETPGDVDARLTYGLILSWNGRYDEARGELRRVLADSPGYTDARVALMNVEWWDGQTHAARELADAVLASNPGNPAARLMRQRLDARTRPWTVTTWYSLDTFDDMPAWHESSVALGRQTPVGRVIVRGTNAARFGYTDQLVEIEAYPTFRAGTYAFLGIGTGTRQDLYPTYRAAFDLYQSLGHGLEISGGYRRLVFTDPVSIYVATLTQYFGQWAVTGRTYFVPSSAYDSWSFHAESRRYVGGAGRSFVGLTVSQGLSREEPRGLGDVIDLRSHAIKGQADLEVTARTRLLFTAGVSRQERALLDPQWQTTMSAGLAWQF
jgi:YaiO family outer membrane protein